MFSTSIRPGGEEEGWRSAGGKGVVRVAGVGRGADTKAGEDAGARKVTGKAIVICSGSSSEGSSVKSSEFLGPSQSRGVKVASSSTAWLAV